MKNKTIFFCNECGYEAPKWMGKCPSCGNWNTFTEEKVEKSDKNSIKNVKFGTEQSVPKKLNDVELTVEQRYKTGIDELDRVLGGGLVKGSLVLLGGDPGIGKSTLLLQMCNSVNAEGNILYASAEESQKQIKMRADRLGIKNDNLLLFAQTDINDIVNAVEKTKPSVIIIDSVQTVYNPELTSAPGSVSQVREVTMTFMRIAKENNISVFLVGHVTKDGSLAGPRVLEHMVDCVLYFEGERHQYHRILRGVKNRFGSTNEIGVFEMRDIGLVQIQNPSAMLLSGRPENVSGSCVVCAMEGTRPILAEIQALVSYTSFPAPRRTASGIDYNRVTLIIAVLEKRAGLKLSTQDVYVNVTGGLRLDEPAADLGIALSIASGFKNFIIQNDTVVMGEIGLTGEIRTINNADKRIKEAVKLGFNNIIVPKGNKNNYDLDESINIKYVSNIDETIRLFS